ncbi:MAG: dethiobiotin synthase [bacterium]
MPGVFITGTDTGVGKTIISAALAFSLKKKSVNVGVMKPVASGGIKKGGRFVSQDAVLLRKAASVDDLAGLINPVCFKNPLAPYPASLIETRGLNLKKIFLSYRKLSIKHEFMVVEGIGGVLVPIKKNYFVIDLIKKMNLPVIVVCRTGLGTINHTLLTVNILRANNIKILCLVFNKMSSEKDLSEKTNARIIENITGLKVIKFPFLHLKKIK